MKVSSFVFSLLFLVLGLAAQETSTLSLADCYKLAKQQYPMIKQLDLIKKSEKYNVQNAARGYLPQINVNGQATYQTPVTKFPFTIPIPGFTMPTFSNDQYKLYAELNQIIYDGGLIKQQKKVQVANAEIQTQNLEVELYALHQRINQLFFGILLIDEQLKLNSIVQNEIQNSVDKVQAAVNNGTAVSSGVDELMASLIQQQQNRIELNATRKAYLDMLGLFINQSLGEKTTLAKPESVIVTDSIRRPELALYEVQRKSYDIQDKIITGNNIPKFSFFAQGGYGRPGLNPFDNNFAPYFIGGVRFNWPLAGLYILKNQRQLLNVNRQMVDIQKETFLLNTSITLRQENGEISKLQEIIAKDYEIIARRTEVKKAAQAQLDNNVITVHEFLNQLDAEDQSKESLVMHQMQLLMAQYNYKTTSGN